MQCWRSAASSALFGSKKIGQWRCQVVVTGEHLDQLLELRILGENRKRACVHARGRSRGALARAPAAPRRGATARSCRRGLQEHVAPWPAARAAARVPAGAGVRLSASSRGRPATCREQARNQKDSGGKGTAMAAKLSLPGRWWRWPGRRRPPLLPGRRRGGPGAAVYGEGGERVSCHSPHLLYVLVASRQGAEL
jgi:hypothetical protein